MRVDFDNRLTGAVIGSAIAVHRELGPGLDEPYYQLAFSEQLTKDGLSHHPQFPLPLFYKGTHLDCGYRPDFVFPNRLVVEIKTVEFLLPVHEAQLITYLRLMEIGLGLLINFDVPVLHEGVRRRVLSPQSRQPTRESPSQVQPDGMFEPVSGEVLAAALEVHRELGAGLLASAYEECLCHELLLRGIPFERKKAVPIRFGGITLPAPLEVQLVVAGQLPVICLAVDELNKLHEARLLGVLRHGSWRSGLLFNFNVLKLHQGLRRVVNPQLRPHP